MKTSLDVLVGLISVKELEIKTQKERIALLKRENRKLSNQLAVLNAMYDSLERDTLHSINNPVGFKTSKK